MKNTYCIIVIFFIFKFSAAAEEPLPLELKILYGQLLDMDPVESTDAYYRSGWALRESVDLVSGLHARNYWSQFQVGDQREDFLVDVRWAELDLAFVHPDRLQSLKSGRGWLFDSIPVDKEGVKKCEQYLQYLTLFCLPIRHGTLLDSGSGSEHLRGVADLITFSEEYLLKAHSTGVKKYTVDDFFDSFVDVKNRKFYFHIHEARVAIAENMTDKEVCAKMVEIYRDGRQAGTLPPSSTDLMTLVMGFADADSAEPFRHVFHEFAISARSSLWTIRHAMALDFIAMDVIRSMDKFGVYDITSLSSDAAERAYSRGAYFAASDIPIELRDQFLGALEVHSERLKKWARFGSFPIGYQEQHWNKFPNGSGSQLLRNLDKEGVEMKDIARYSAMMDSIWRETEALENIMDGLEGNIGRLQGRLDRFVENSINWLDVEIRRVQGHAELAEWGKGMEEELEDIKAALGK